MYSIPDQHCKCPKSRRVLTFLDPEKACPKDDGGLFGDLPEPIVPKAEKRKQDHDDDLAPSSKRKLQNDGNFERLYGLGLVVVMKMSVIFVSDDYDNPKSYCQSHL